MARLDREKRREWKAALLASPASWIGCGIDVGQENPSASLEGVPGLIDWMVHGQVSGLVLRGEFARGECCLIPGDQTLGRPNYLFFPIHSPAGPAALLEKARKLGVKEIALAESTFPEDFLGKLKQNFKKEGIRFATLEAVEAVKR
jgi:hypothetical protein